MAPSACFAFGVSGLIGFVASSLFFAYHSPGALEVSLQEEYHLTTEQIGVFFTAYSFPNMILTVFAGLAIDRFGLKRTGFALLFLIGGGSAIFAMAPRLSRNPFAIMTLGRFVVGLGGESIITWQQAACAFWFGGGAHEGKSFGMALAVQQSIGSAASFFVLETVARQVSVEFALWFVVFFVMVSGLALCLYCTLEVLNLRYLLEEMKRTVNVFPGAFLFCLPLVKHKPQTVVVEEEDEEVATDGFFRTVEKFGALFWVQNVCIFFIVSILYTSANFFPFLLEAQKNDHGYGMSKVEASQCTSMIYWMVIFAPIAGTLLDSYGRRLTTQILCTSGAIVLFLIMHFTSVSPWITISGIGLMFAFLEQNAYSILTKTFEHLGGSVEGTGFGIMGVFLNSGLMVIAPLVGFFRDITGSYGSQIQLYLFFLSTGLVLSVLLCSLDKNGILNEKPGDIEPLEGIEEPFLSPVKRSISVRSGASSPCRPYDNIKAVSERSGSFSHGGA